jgi:hypothetical protein
VFKCKLTSILESIFLAGQLGLMQTCLDRRAPPPEQKTPPSTPPLTWNKNVVPSPVHAKPSHWLHDFIFSKILGHHFQPGLIIIPLPKSVGIHTIAIHIY